ncbi:hypothetical protein H8E06_00865 [bacterium]|nr:hypothetical protein [bacterium]
MKIISTFNEEMYHATGKRMLETAETYIPDAEKIVYGELSTKLDYETIDVCGIDQFKTVFDQNRDVITQAFGGDATSPPGIDKSFNIRWFGWFRKIAMWHHAICETKHDDYVLFVDSDIRFLDTFTDDFIADVTKGKAVSYFKGTRPVIESGFVVVNGRDPNAAAFYKILMEQYLSKEFRSFTRWDDSMGMQQAVKKCPPEWFLDFAKNKQWKIHKNSNGYVTGGQVICQTPWGKYMEHDKGVHWKQEVVPHTAMHDPGASRKA